MKKSSILGLVVIAVAIAIIVCTYSKASVYGSFKDAMATNAPLQIVGQLDKQKQLYYDATKDANYFSFYMRDNKGEERKVVFTGTKPPDFEKSENIVLTGQMAGNEFHAKSILMKCPSKYKQDKVEVTEYKAKSATI